MNKIKTRIFNAYDADRHIDYYVKQGIKSHFIFEYHNQPVDSDGLVQPKKIWSKSLNPIKPKDVDLEIKYNYKLSCEEEIRLSILNSQIDKAKKLVNKLESKKSKLENEILDEVIKDFDYESIYEGDYWDCHLSPLGHCIYTDDFGEPECIFCGEPEERK